jgi:hypothetical protein
MILFKILVALVVFGIVYSLAHATDDVLDRKRREFRRKWRKR